MKIRKEVIGDAILYLGDCRDILPTLDGVDAVVTDPPYGMAFVSNHRATKYASILGDNDPELMTWICDQRFPHSSYIFCRWEALRYVRQPQSMITWVKNNWSMGDLEHEHARQTEACLFYRGEQHYFPKYRPPDWVAAPRTGNDHHPTEKPAALMRAVVEWTAGIISDPFMGSGTTGVACARLSRKFIGIEIHESYFDIACRRIEEAYRHQDLFIHAPVEPEKPRRDLFSEMKEA